MTDIDAKMSTFHWLFAYKWHWSNAPSKITPLKEQVTAKNLLIYRILYLDKLNTTDNISNT